MSGDPGQLSTPATSELPPGVTVISIYPMYSPAQIFLATLLGGPLGGGWLMTLNYRRMGRPRSARVMLALTVLSMAGIIAIGFAAGSHAATGLYFGPIIVITALASVLQGGAHQTHVELGGRRGSTRRAAGLGLVSAAICAVLLAGALILQIFVTRPDHVTVGHNNVFYTGGVSRAEAAQVGRAIDVVAQRRADETWDLEVTRDRGRPVVGIVVHIRDASDEQFQRDLHAFAEPLSRAVYGGGPLDIWLVDGRFQPRAKLAWEHRPQLEERK